MPSCNRIRKRLSYYVVGGLGDRGRRNIEAHLRTCEACRAEVSALERTGALLDQVGALSAPEGSWEAVHGRITARPRPRARPAVRWGWRVAVGAAAVLTVLLAVVFLRPGPGLAPRPVLTASVTSDDTDTEAILETHLSAQWASPLADEAAVGLRLAGLEGGG